MKENIEPKQYKFTLLSVCLIIPLFLIGCQSEDRNTNNNATPPINTAQPITNDSPPSEDTTGGPGMIIATQGDTISGPQKEVLEFTIKENGGIALKNISYTEVEVQNQIVTKYNITPEGGKYEFVLNTRTEPDIGVIALTTRVPNEVMGSGPLTSTALLGAAKRPYHLDNFEIIDSPDGLVSRMRPLIGLMEINLDDLQVINARDQADGASYVLIPSNSIVFLKHKSTGMIIMEVLQGSNKGLDNYMSVVLRPDNSILSIHMQRAKWTESLLEPN